MRDETFYTNRTKSKLYWSEVIAGCGFKSPPYNYQNWRFSKREYANSGPFTTWYSTTWYSYKDFAVGFSINDDGFVEFIIVYKPCDKSYIQCEQKFNRKITDEDERLIIEALEACADTRQIPLLVGQKWLEPLVDAVLKEVKVG